MRITNTAPLLLLLALASYPLVADAFRFNILLETPPRSKWGDSNAMEVPRRDLGLDYSSDYSYSDVAFFLGESEQEAGDDEFEFRLNIKGDVEESFRETIGDLIRSNMVFYDNYLLVFPTTDLHRDYDGSLCQPNSCEARWQATYLDVGFKVIALDQSTSRELQYFFDTTNLAAELQASNPDICGAQLVSSNSADRQAQKRREHDEKLNTPRAFDMERKYGN